MNLGLFAPELVLAATAIAVILLDLFVEKKGLLAGLGIIGLLVSAGITISMWGTNETLFNGMFTVDTFALFFKLLFIGIAALVILASNDYVSKFSRFRGEYHAIVLLSALGMMLMAATRELISIYIALELTSISLYVLSGFLKDKKSSESSLKYLLLGAISSSVLLFGMALVFGSTGQTELANIAAAIGHSTAGGSVMDNPALVLGVVMLIAGFGFKIAAIPFQLWVPDVYEGAPTPVVAFLSVGSKAAGFAVILRVFTLAFGLPDWLSVAWGSIFAALAAIGMFVGNISAIPQTNIKRMLGYSSIAQAGYLMVGLAAMGVSDPTGTGHSAVIFFLSGYALANLGAFSAIIAISNKIESDLIADFSGMIKRAPVLTLALSLCLISLIGMPPAAGFMAKFYIFNSAVQGGLLWLVIIAVLNSVISAFYYLRVVKVMWFGDPASEEKVPSTAALRVGLTLSCIGVLILGVVPGPVMDLAETAIARLFG